MNKIAYIDPNSPYQCALNQVNMVTKPKPEKIDLAWARRHLRCFAHSQDAVRRAQAHKAESRRNAERNAQ